MSNFHSALGWHLGGKSQLLHFPVATHCELTDTEHDANGGEDTIAPPSHDVLLANGYSALHTPNHTSSSGAHLRHGQVWRGANCKLHAILRYYPSITTAMGSQPQTSPGVVQLYIPSRSTPRMFFVACVQQITLFGQITRESDPAYYGTVLKQKER